MRIAILISVASLLLMRCAKNDNGIFRISTPGSKAESVYLTKNDKGNAVIVWTESIDTTLRLCYAISKEDGHSFSAPVILALDNESPTHAEGMPKVAFKNDGTVIVAYEKRNPTAGNKYAGTICYITSSDGGTSWSKENYLHRDTTAGRSRSFFDIETLPDGEIGAAWLDIKINSDTGGRSVRFAKTNSENKFVNEVLVDSSACQCCRVDVYADKTGVNVAYRGLMKGPMGASIRDMMIATSESNGLAFSHPTRISADNWNIDGCPHTGPALCSTKGNLLALWYTEGNGTGIYFAHRGEQGDTFSDKQILSGIGRHPQASANEQSMAMVWEENTTIGDDQVTRIVYQTTDGKSIKRESLTPETGNAYLPVISSMENGFIVAFIMEEHEEAGCYIKVL